jgi:hypothetical protein
MSCMYSLPVTNGYVVNSRLLLSLQSRGCDGLIAAPEGDRAETAVLRLFCD